MSGGFFRLIYNNKSLTTEQFPGAWNYSKYFLCIISVNLNSNPKK